MGPLRGANVGRRWPLVGRDEVLAVLDDDLAAAGALLVGDPGVGKSRLAREALARAAGRGAATVSFTATTSAATIPLGALAAAVPTDAHGSGLEMLQQVGASLAARAMPSRDRCPGRRPPSSRRWGAGCAAGSPVSPWTPLTVDAATLLTARNPVQEASLVTDEAPGAAPAVDRFLTDAQLETLRTATGRSAAAVEAQLAQLAPVIAAPIAASHTPLVSVADQLHFGVGRAVATVDLPAFLLEPWRTWHGHLPLPPNDGRSYRLVVREYEHAPSDETVLIHGVRMQVLGRRVVYADVVRL